MQKPNRLLKQGALNNPLISLFSELPNVLFWVKDTELKTIWVNHVVAYYVNLTEAQIIGKTDMEIYPRELALKFEKDDRDVMNTGEPILGRAELLINRFGAIEWRKVSKVPIFDQHKHVIGTAGISIPLMKTPENLSSEFKVFTQVFDHAREQLQNQISVKDLARFARVSESTLIRRFREHLKMTPQQYLCQLRIAKACQLLLESTLNVAEISDLCGYKSSAAFSRAFKKIKHLSPSKYRSAV